MFQFDRKNSRGLGCTLVGRVVKLLMQLKASAKVLGEGNFLFNSEK